MSSRSWLSDGVKGNPFLEHLEKVYEKQISFS